MVPRKANQPTLKREEIVAAAIALVDSDGLEGLSMRKLAAELGVGTMSLYYHVPDKSSLYDLILDAIVGELDLSVDDKSKSPEERVIAGAQELRRALLAHPKAASLSLARSFRTPAQLRAVEVFLGMMLDAGLSLTDGSAAVDIIGQYVFGMSVVHATHVADLEYHDPERDADFSAVTPEEFPNMARVLAEADYLGPDAEFDRGLRVLVHGLLVK